MAAEILRRSVLLGPLLAGLAVAAPAPASPTQEARDFVESTVNDVLAVLQSGATSEERRQRIEEIAYARFHFETMSRLVLARHWRRFTPAQQQDFLREFRELLSQSYGRRIDRYEQEKVEMGKSRLEPRGDVTVRTRIVGGQADNFVVDYRLRNRDEGWGVIDVVVEGVSLVSSYKEQFAEVLGRSGPEGLLERMREKNASQRLEGDVASSGGG